MMHIDKCQRLIGFVAAAFFGQCLPPFTDILAVQFQAQQKRRIGQLNRLRRLDRSWNPKFNLVGSLQKAGARTPEAIVDHLADQLLAIELPAETRAYLLEEYTARRAAVKVTGKRFKDRNNEEQLLCSFAHLILSLPEAQLN